jgi:hypothetical protein
MGLHPRQDGSQVRESAAGDQPRCVLVAAPLQDEDSGSSRSTRAPSSFVGDV